jgi:phosphoribosylaminoimidazole (AIR) synthetase
MFCGSAGHQRTVGLSQEKATSYIEDVRTVLDRSQRYMSKPELQKLHRWLNRAAQIMPCMGGFMSELNRVLASAHITIGLGLQSSLRHMLEDFAYILDQAHGNPSHIVELVGTDAPHVYGYTNAC